MFINSKIDLHDQVLQSLDTDLECHWLVRNKILFDGLRTARAIAQASVICIEVKHVALVRCEFPVMLGVHELLVGIAVD